MDQILCQLQLWSGIVTKCEKLAALVSLFVDVSQQWAAAGASHNMGRIAVGLDKLSCVPPLWFAYQRRVQLHEAYISVTKYQIISYNASLSNKPPTYIGNCVLVSLCSVDYRANTA